MVTRKLLPVEALLLYEQDRRLIQVERTTVTLISVGNSRRGLRQTGFRQEQRNKDKIMLMVIIMNTTKKRTTVPYM